MQSDDVIWQVINNGFCSFKIKTDTGPMCRNENNVTGMCNKISCPLANSRYATVREVDGACFLYKKVIERSHMPARMWEKIRLKGSLEQITERINKELEYMPEFYKAKCQARYIRYQEYLRRVQRLQNDPTQPILTTKNQKVLRRERSREARSKQVAQIENAIERELLERLQKGVYGDIYNLPQKTFDNILAKHGEEQEMDEELEYVEDDEEEEEEVDYEDEDDDVEFLDNLEESGDEDLEDFVPRPAQKSKSLVEIEYEDDNVSLNPIRK